MTDTVSVNLPRARWWVHGNEGARGYTVYGPGEATIPRAMAEGLVRAGELSAESIGVDAVAPSDPEPGAGPVTEIEIDATDAATELAEAEGLDLATVTGTGADGRILKSDVEAALGGK